MKILNVLTILLFVSGNLIAQFPVQTTFISGDSLSIIGFFEYDNSGNIFIAGQIKDTGYVDTVVNPSARLVANTDHESFFLAKLDPAGNFLWGGTVGNKHWNHVDAMELDDSGNVYIGGAFEDTVDFDIDTGVYQRIAKPYGRDIFLAKYNSSGKLQWINQIGNGGNYEELKDLVIDFEGNVIFTGSVYDSTDVDPGPGTHYILTRKWHDIVLVKYTGQGQLIWATNLGGNDLDEGHTLSVDNSGNIFVAGEFNDTIYMDSANTAVHYATTTGFWDYVIGKYSKDGQYIWSKFFGNQYLEEITNSLVDDQSNLYIIGNYQGTMDFDLSSGVDTIKAMSGNAFIAKYDAMGNYQWANVLNGDWTICYGMEFDLLGNLVVAGIQWGDMYLDPSSTTLSDTTTNINAFAVLYDRNGKYLSHVGAHNRGFSFAWDAKMNFNGEVAFSGLFTNEFPVDSIRVFKKSGNDADGFMASYDLPCHSFKDTVEISICAYDSIQLGGVYRKNSGYYDDTVSLVSSCYHFRTYNLKVDSVYNTDVNATICNGVFYFIGGQQFTTTGNYSVLLNSKQGCDSNINLNLIVNNIDMSFSQAVDGGGNINVSNPGDSIRWLDCNTGLLIPNITGNNFNTIKNGRYAFIKYDNGCADTSTCIDVIYAAIQSLSNDEIKIFPNPSEGILWIEFEKSQLREISIFDVKGEKVHTHFPTLSSGIEIILPAGIENGEYILKIESPDKRYVRRFQVIRH